MSGKIKLTFKLLTLLTIVILGVFISPEKTYAALSIDSISPTTITSPDDVITISVSASNLSSNTQYIQVGMTKENQTKYFGYTKNNSDQWVNYISSPDSSEFNSFFSFTPENGSWSGTIQTKIDAESLAYGGPGIYNLKLFKYISSSATYSNVVSFDIDLPLSPPPPAPAPPSPTPSPSPSPSAKPQVTFDFSLPNSPKVGEEFSVPIQITNLDSSTHYLKIRIGVDDSHLNKGQTYNSDWFDDNDSWTKFPQITGPSWQGSVSARLPQGEKEGSYKVAIRVKKTSSDSFVESGSKETTFKPGAPLPSSSKSPPPLATAKTTAGANVKSVSANFLPPNSQIIASVAAASSSDDVLGVGTSSATQEKHRVSPFLQKEIPVKVLSQRHSLPVKDLLITCGLFLTGFAFTFALRGVANNR